MELIPHLSFDGRCAEAFEFYERVLDGKIVMMQTHGESPAKDHVPANWQDKIIHARLVTGKSVLMGMDAPPPRYSPPQGMFVTINVAPDKAERVFNALAEEGTVTMPFQKTFWSSGFGMAVDRFGIPWMVNSEQAVAQQPAPRAEADPVLR